MDTPGWWGLSDSLAIQSTSRYDRAFANSFGIREIEDGQTKVDAHRRLCGRGWLHRDVNPSNILLATDEERAKRAPGFMIDFDSDYAPVVTKTVIPPQTLPDHWVPQAPLCTPSTTVAAHPNVFNTARSVPTTPGSPRFLSRRQLTRLLEPELSLAPTPEDDVESLFIVLVYAMTRALACSDRMERLCTRRNRVPDEEIQTRKQQLLAFLEQHWGVSASVHELHRSRRGGAFVMEILESDPMHGAGDVGRWFAAHGQPKLVSAHLLKGILYRSVCKFVYLEQFDTDSSISDEDESESAEDTKATLRAEFSAKSCLPMTRSSNVPGIDVEGREFTRTRSPES
ncbi:hypothetical protein V8D89_003020 [Ganoderma adspersum]